MPEGRAECGGGGVVGGCVQLQEEGEGEGGVEEDRSLLWTTSAARKAHVC